VNVTNAKILKKEIIMIVLVTGTPGSGKTLFVVSKILELQKQFPDRKIYSDIEGLQIDGVEQSPDDWRTTPDNSIVIYDEAQQHERFRAGTQANKDEVVQKLQVHRHTGHDIWFITQSPRFLNAFVLDLVGEHYHLHRPYGAKLASVYYWRSVRKQPQSLASRELAENEFLFKYPKELFNVYKSATQHNVKLKVPKKLWLIVAAIVIMLGFVVKMIYSDGSQKMLNGTLGTASQKTELEAKKETSNSALTVNAASDLSSSDLNTECRKGVNVEKPECVKWFNDLSKNGGSIQTKSETNAFTISYNPNKPYDVDLSNVPLQVVDYPRLTGCIKKPTGDIVGIDQQGNIMPNLDKQACQKWLKGERLFDYTKQKNESQNVQVSNQATNPQPNQPIVQQMAQIEQAENEGLI
jgi:zona occludens toxin